MDIDNIPYGLDFRVHLQQQLNRCDILIVVVGPRWFGLNDAGQPRLFEEADWVRIEVASALAKKIPVIPLLIDGTQMPPPNGLPDDLRELAFRQAFALDTGVDFRVHMDRLTKSMDRVLTARNLPSGLLDEKTAPVDKPRKETPQESPVAEDRPHQSDLLDSQMAAPIEDHLIQTPQIGSTSAEEDRSHQSGSGKSTSFFWSARKTRLLLATVLLFLLFSWAYFSLWTPARSPQVSVAPSPQASVAPSPQVSGSWSTQDFLGWWCAPGTTGQIKSSGGGIYADGLAPYFSQMPVKKMGEKLLIGQNNSLTFQVEYKVINRNRLETEYKTPSGLQVSKTYTRCS